jgi:hypothetical protein
VKEWKVSVLSLMETSDRIPRHRHSVNRARAAAVNYNINYEVKNL